MDPLQITSPESWRAPVTLREKLKNNTLIIVAGIVTLAVIISLLATFFLNKNSSNAFGEKWNEFNSKNYTAYAMAADSPTVGHTIKGSVPDMPVNTNINIALSADRLTGSGSGDVEGRDFSIVKDQDTIYIDNRSGAADRLLNIPQEEASP